MFRLSAAAVFARPRRDRVSTAAVLAKRNNLVTVLPLLPGGAGEFEDCGDYARCCTWNANVLCGFPGDFTAQVAGECKLLQILVSLGSFWCGLFEHC